MSYRSQLVDIYTEISEAEAQLDITLTKLYVAREKLRAHLLHQDTQPAAEPDDWQEVPEAVPAAGETAELTNYPKRIYLCINPPVQHARQQGIHYTDWDTLCGRFNGVNCGAYVKWCWTVTQAQGLYRARHQSEAFLIDQDG